jgi:acetyltransferase-like isoleucine patch superfamily enzyme
MSTLTKAFETPWKISDRIGSWVIYPYVTLLFMLNGIPRGKGWSFYGAPIIQKHHNSLIAFGDGLHLRSSMSSNPLGINHPVIIATLQETARLEVGRDFAMSGGTLCAAEKIMIGHNVGVGANTMIVDTDFHSMNAQVRRISPSEAKTAPVIIEDDVFIGMNCLILKGVTIGKGSVVGAGSVVTRDIPSYVIVAGNPAQIIKKI